ncbi:MAG: mitochondrial fission ELM1 family protein [Methylobacteriaceae bacterium]|nr:mitochondrial fission ELM1 family protein [Methylobacteriaceae bacterium]
MSAEAASSVAAWILTDGKAGDEGQCLGVAETLGLVPRLVRLAPRPLFAWLAPRGPLDPRLDPTRPGSPLAPPWPDLAIASGRRAVPAVRALKRASGGRVYTVVLKDPRTGPGTADLIWIPSYDPLRGPNVVATLTSPHRLSPSRLAAARARPDPRLASLPRPLVAVAVGGHSRHLRFRDEDCARLVDGLARLARDGASLAITPSRRTPPALRARLAALAGASGGFLWDGAEPNPYEAMMALADAIVVTGDSVNMICEAVATGAAVLVFEMPHGAKRHLALVAELERLGAVRPFRGQLEAFRPEPLDVTPLIAQAVADGLARHRAALGLE